MKSLIACSVAAAALLSGAASAEAHSPGEMFDSCKPHDWQRYADAV